MKMKEYQNAIAQQAIERKKIRISNIIQRNLVLNLIKKGKAI